MCCERRRGFTLLEMVATVAILAILAASVIPNLVAYQTRTNVENSAAFLVEVASAATAYQVKTTAWPFRINHLVKVPTINDSSSCSNIPPQNGGVTKVSNFNISQWNLASGGGPFFYRLDREAGIPIPIGTVRDTLFRTANGAGFLQIKIVNVRIEDLYELNGTIDGVSEALSSTSGKIQWTGSPTNNLITGTYNITIGGGC